jgi:anthranilate/para-aminobenzoate synthase component II
MEPVIYAKQTGAGPEPKSAIQWIIEIVQCLDKAEDGTIMGICHREHPVHGVQFHPESIATEHGHALLKNFLDLAKAS